MGGGEDDGMLTRYGCSQARDLYPLRDSVFEATPVKVPFQYAWLLEEEYGKESLYRTEFEKFAHLCSTLVCSTLLTMTQPLGTAGMRRL